jgi:hypothetical protein
MLVELPGGLILPIEYVIVLVTIPLVIILVIGVLLFRRKDESPIEENMALIVPIDTNGTLQVGQLVGNVELTEDDLRVTNPDWIDEETGAKYSMWVPKEKKIPFPFFDIEKHLKKLWIIFDKGHLEVASASEIVNGLPSRYDVPLTDRRKDLKLLVGKGVLQTLASAFTTKTGVITLLGLVTFGAFMAVTIISLSGHLK